jgi:hypothetical protein
METEVRNHSTKLAGQKAFAARNPAPIIPRPLVLSTTRIILAEVTTRSVINHESMIGRRRASPIFLVFLPTADDQNMGIENVQKI